VASLDAGDATGRASGGPPPEGADAARERIRQLEAALESRIAIEQAKGVLRERFGWSMHEAFEILRYAARSARVSIHTLAVDVVSAEETPPAITIALARSARWRAAFQREHADARRTRAEQLALRIRAQQERFAWEQRRGERVRARGGDGRA
jgi:hypothetical protein